jgi:YVTN family beta-propeller protein
MEILVVLPVLLFAAATAHGAPFAYIPNGESNTVTVVDTADNTVRAVVPVGGTAYGVAVDPRGAFAYVSNNIEAGTVSVIDTATNEVAVTIPVGAHPAGMAVQPTGAFVYVANGRDRTVSVIDTATKAVVATVALPIAPPSEGESGPFAVAVHPAGTYVYVSAFNDTVSVIETATNTLVATVGLGGTPGAHCTFSTGSCPTGIAVHPRGRYVYVARYLDSSGTGANGGPGALSVIDTTTNLETTVVPIEGISPAGVAMHPAGTFVYVANSRSDTLSVIDTDTNTVVATVPVGPFPHGVAVHPLGTYVYVTNFMAGTMSIVATASNTVVGTVTVGATPYAVGQFVGFVNPGLGLNTPPGTNVTAQPRDSVTGTNPVKVTYPSVSQGGNTTLTTSASGPPPPAGFSLGDPATYYDVTTTASFSGPVTVCITYNPGQYADPSSLHLLHYEGNAWTDVTTSHDTTNHVICGQVSSLSLFVLAEWTLAAQIQQPISADGSSTFNATRGVVPVKFTLASGGVPTCALPPATIALTRTGGPSPGPVDEAVYMMAADVGSNFRITDCQYLYNLAAKALGPGSYVVTIKFNGITTGSARFDLK